MQFYLKLIHCVLLPAPLQPQLYCYSSFFMEKLISEFTRDDFIMDKDAHWLSANVRLRVADNYAKLARWTKREDIFQKELIVIPINAFRHWFCVLVLRPFALLEPKGESKCELVYCDSMF